MTGTDDHLQDRLPPTSGSAVARRRAEERELRGPPEFVHWESREPGHRLSERWVPEPEHRAAPGDRLAIHPDAVRELRPKNPVRPAPNAPLLMRIVRSPYAMQPVKHVRTSVRDQRVVSEPREILGRPGTAWRELRAELTLPNPMRSLPHRPEPRPRPKATPAATGEGSSE